METFQALEKTQCKIDFWATFKILWGTQFNFFENFDIKYIKYTLFVTIFVKNIFCYNQLYFSPKISEQETTTY